MEGAALNEAFFGWNVVRPEEEGEGHKMSGECVPGRGAQAVLEDPQGPGGAGRGMERASPRDLRESGALLTPWSQTSSLQNCGR